MRGHGSRPIRGRSGGRCPLNSLLVVLAVVCASITVASIGAGPARAQQQRGGVPTGFATRVIPASPTLSANDRALDCPTLKNVVLGIVDELKRSRAAAVKESAAPATTLLRLTTRASGPPGAGIEALEHVQPLRRRADALAQLHATKQCGRLDVAALLRPAVVVKPEARDRCRARTDFELEDCVEDIAQWRCRGFAGTGRAYLECLADVAPNVIAASGFQATRLGHYSPDCTARTYDPATCSVFSNNRGQGAGTSWCKRADEGSIEVCDLAGSKPAAGAAPKLDRAIPDLSNTTPAVDPTSKANFSTFANKIQKPGGAANPVKAGAHINCHKVQCSLGTCNRLCAPPV